MTSDAAAVIVDARGMRCPWPALRLARAMRVASEVLLIADDPQVGREVAALADEHGWRWKAEIGPADAEQWHVRRD